MAVPTRVGERQLTAASACALFIMKWKKGYCPTVPEGEEANRLGVAKPQITKRETEQYGLMPRCDPRGYVNDRRKKRPCFCN